MCFPGWSWFGSGCVSEVNHFSPLCLSSLSFGHSPSSRGIYQDFCPRKVPIWLEEEDTWTPASCSPSPGCALCPRQCWCCPPVTSWPQFPQALHLCPTQHTKERRNGRKEPRDSVSHCRAHPPGWLLSHQALRSSSFNRHPLDKHHVLVSFFKTLGENFGC